MKFYMPTLVYDEPNAVLRHAGQLASYGERALIVTGKTSAKTSGALDDVVAALVANEKSYVIFDGVEENPSVETVMKARDLGVAEGVDFVIGVGGGSPMDAAKAIALMIENKDHDESLLRETRRMLWLPVICVPTTCGTGSEVTGVSVLTWHGRQTKASIPYKIFPEMALVDGKYISRAPQQVVADTAIDAFAHLVESALSVNGDFYSRSLAGLGLSTWAEARESLLDEASRTPENCTTLMRASTLAGIAIAQTGTAIPHALSYKVTYDCNISHGQAVALFLPSFLECAPKEETDTILEIAGFGNLDAFREFLERLLPRVEVPEETLQETVKFVRTNPAKLESTSFPVDMDMLNRIAGIEE